MLIVRSPVRISFGGGGTDLPAYFENFGGAVLSATINKYFYTIVSQRADRHVQIISSDLRTCESWENIRDINAKGHALEIPLAVLKELGREVAADIFLASEIPPGTGLGSSACVCVSVLHAMATYLEIPLTRNELAEKAFSIARHILEKPVGKQDEYASAFGGLNFMRFAPNGSTEVEPLNLAPNIMAALQARLMLFFIGGTRNSWSILQEQQEATRSGERVALESLHRIRELANQMREILITGNLYKFGLLLHEGWENKKRISSMISNPAIDRMYGLARANGATGGKITGAGGGGFMLLYCDEEKQPAVRNAFLEQGIKEMRFAFDFSGSRVLVNELFADSDHVEDESASTSLSKRR
ncbi:MAG TPA: GHMP kinase [Candidatus Angelobacter sp.]|jgi:D-glycero-alpha-D-manno-heptose-7-phosphate kinase|nr:GHMP kinase [Candidatus Angelobacter sp.]